MLSMLKKAAALIAIIAMTSAGSLLLAQTDVAERLPQSNPDEALMLELRDVVTSWASAWQSQLDDVYLLHYHPDFKPEGFKSVAEWQASRRNRVRDPGNIQIGLSDFSVVAARDNNRAVVRFWLLYSRPGYADKTRKEMELRKLGQIWLIASEHNLGVTKLAPP